MQAVDRILLLQSSPLLSRATAAQLVGLAGIARPVTLKAGEDPVSGSEAGILVVLSGAVRVERDGAPPDTAETGDAIGIYETLGGVPFPVRAEVTQEGQALRFMRSDLFDLLADNIDLLQGIFSGLLARTSAGGAGKVKSLVRRDFRLPDGQPSCSSGVTCRLHFQARKRPVLQFFQCGMGLAIFLSTPYAHDPAHGDVRGKPNPRSSEPGIDPGVWRPLDAGRSVAEPTDDAVS